MVAFTGHFILWILCALFRFFVIGGICYGVYYIIKNKREWWLVEKHQREAEKKEREEQWKRISKEWEKSGFSLRSSKKEMTPKEKIEYEKRMARIKKDKKVAIIALSIFGLLMLAGIIASFFE